MKPSSTAIQEALRDALSLEKAPKRIECFDISHIQGTDKVASMVVWEDGRTQMSRADTRPPSWPTFFTSGSVARASTMSIDAGHLVLGPLPAEEVRVDLGLPSPEARTGPGAQGAALGPVGAVGGTALLVHVERLVDAVVVVVVQDRVGAHDDAGGTAGAQSGRHDLVVEVGPVEFFGWHGGRPLHTRRRTSRTDRGADGYGRPMPELLEVERYRRAAEAERWTGTSRRSAWTTPTAWPPGHRRVHRVRLVGRRFLATRRRGKLLVLATGHHDLGIRFGMTGTLVVDGLAAIDRLVYSPGHDERWVRFGVHFADGGTLALHDPRRLARVVLAPDEAALGPDALTVTPSQLRTALAARSPAADRRSRPGSSTSPGLAGIGNLLADEILWRAGLSPLRPSGSLDEAELRRLHRRVRTTLPDLAARGGSHTGDLMDHRRPGGRCPRDGAELRRSVVGGRTTWWCPAHQH